MKNSEDINDKTRNEAAKKDRSTVNSVIIGALGVVSGAYLMVPGSSLIQASIEWIPVIGQFDEVAAAAILFSCISYFGLDLTSFFEKAKAYDKRSEGKKTATKTVNAKVVDP